MRRRSKKSGFTIAEILVSIVVLTISISGVLAALAYDAFSSEQSGAYTFALGYSRKLMDMFQSNQLDPLVYCPTGPPAAVDSNIGNDGTNWHNLDGTTGNLDVALNTGGGVADFWGAPGSIERRRFDTEKQKYGVNYVANRWEPVAAAVGVENKFKNLLVRVIVTTRWRARSGFRSVRLEGFYVASQV